MATNRELIDAIAEALGRVVMALEQLANQLEPEPDPEPEPPSPVVTMPGQRPPRHPRIREFDYNGAVVLHPDMDGPAVVASHGENRCFLLEPGEYRWQDLRWKRGQYFLSRDGKDRTIFNGAGRTYGFRASGPTANDCTIGGITLRDYGLNRNDNALFAAVSPRHADTLFQTSVTTDDWYGGQASGTVLHDCTLERNGTNGFSMGNNGAAIRVTARGHFKTGIGVDRVTGGLIEDCDLLGNALDPATGQFADGGDFKGVFINGTKGLFDVEPAQFIPPASAFTVRNTRFTAKDPLTGKGSPLGCWLDLDGQLVVVEGCSFTGYEWAGLVFELCTDVVVRNNLFKGCGGYGSSLGQDFVLGALTLRETCWAWVEGNRFEGCQVPLQIAQSNRTSDLDRAPRQKYDVTYAWRGAPFPGDVLRPWIDPGYTAANAKGAMSNLATAEVDFVNNHVDGGRVVVNAGSIKNGRDPQAAAKALSATKRFRGNTYGPSVRFEELGSGLLTLDAWRQRGSLNGWQRDQ